MLEEKICWTCGHYAFACFARKEVDYSKTSDDTCNKWCPEGTKGTVTDVPMEELDGTTLEENTYLKDDMSNL
ncbi:hypothetical protein SporoP37_15775 [Sporosarcina sp. P37]|uniref:hypothetical protein n=1 Tax=unclassified Sporosarcina TaxID=2647733 RepID=UPI000A17D172|nr:MULTISPECIES: hypothetical protein [unclassified Sporosarcina]ARK25985.1 hypothetical protein SporoP37_15775 [Sporosarcina sp. P37]PID19355.1 hypothetical protein CSV62_02295 [Sporosarcina sp. P35]